VQEGKEFKAFEADGWSRRAPTYQLLFGEITAHAIEPLLEAAGVGAGMRVLDAAAGPGRLAAAAAARGATPVGLDIAEGMIELARRNHPQLEFHLADVEELPFADGSFDAVAGAFVLNHLPRPGRGVAELARVLAPGGGLALSVWDVPQRNRFMGVLMEALEAADAPSAELPAGPDPFAFAGDEVFATLLREAGLENVAVRTLAFSHRIGDADELWDGFMHGSVRTATRLRALSPSQRARAHQELARGLEAHRAGEWLEVPAVAKIGSGRRP